MCVCTHHTFFIHSPTDGHVYLCCWEERTRSLCVLCVCVCVYTACFLYPFTPHGCIHFVTERTGGQGRWILLGCRDPHGKRLSLCWTPINVSRSPSQPVDPTAKKIQEQRRSEFQGLSWEFHSCHLPNMWVSWTSLPAAFPASAWESSCRQVSTSHGSHFAWRQTVPPS